MKMKINKYLTSLMLLAIGGLCSCTDTWDEHYDGVADSKMFDGTIMQMLEQNPDLSNFAKVVKAAGFDSELNSAQSYTLWAPSNSALSESEWNEWLTLANTNKKDVVTRFIKNHMTRYNVSLDGNPHTIKLLNTKTGHMSDAITSTYGSANIINANNACDNGVVHVIDAAQPYLPNLYEEIETQFRTWKAANMPGVPDDSIISIYSFLKKYNDDSLDQLRSVSVGVDENGEYLWIDSVMMRNNTILKGYDALLYTEDSVYSVLLPSIEAYQRRYEEAKKYLQFNPSENIADRVDQRISTTDSMQHYYASTFAMNDLFFNDNFNKHPNDSVVSTQWVGGSKWEQHRFYNPYSGDGIFTVGKPVECSNGKAYYSDDYPVTIYDQFLKKIDMPLSTTSVDLTVNEKTPTTGLYTKTCTYYMSSATNYETNKNISFLKVTGSTSTSNYSVAFQIRNLLKAEYDVYLVYSPLWVTKYPSYEKAYEQAMADSLLAVEKGDKSKSWKADIRPYRFNVTTFERQHTQSSLGKYPTKGTSVKPLDGAKYFFSNVENVVDTMYIGSIAPDCAYYQTDKEGVLIQFETKIQSKETSDFSREMNLIGLIIKPREDALASNKR